MLIYCANCAPLFSDGTTQSSKQCGSRGQSKVNSTEVQEANMEGGKKKVQDAILEVKQTRCQICRVWVGEGITHDILQSGFGKPPQRKKWKKTRFKVSQKHGQPNIQSMSVELHHVTDHRGVRVRHDPSPKYFQQT